VDVMRRRARIAFLSLLVCAVLLPGLARSHEFALDSLANAFVEIEAGEANLVVRVPLHALRSAKFPLSGREIPLADAAPAVQRALAALERDLSLWEEARLLVPTNAVGRLSLPSDRSFERYDDAVAHIGQSPDPRIAIFVDQGYFDARLTYAITSPSSRFSIQTRVAPELQGLLRLAIRYLPPGEPGRSMVITSRSGRVSLNPAWWQAAGGFAELGIAHILSGVDHLLFLLCLVVPLLRFRQVLPIVTAFTVAHSFTLLGSAYGLAPTGAWFPPFVETAIAASIVYMALENIAGSDLRRRWLVAGLFGLVHGFGFSYGLQQDIQFAGRHLLVALFSFNVGIEIGQLAVLAALLPALAVLRRRLVAERVGVIILSAIVAHTAWHWMIDRGAVLWSVDWPRLDAAALSTLARWAAGVLLAAAAFKVILRRAGAVPSRAVRDGASAE
jgi:HupE / UreJ protein